jgi:hypothetical protein
MAAEINVFSDVGAIGQSKEKDVNIVPIQFGKNVGVGPHQIAGDIPFY